MVHHDILRIVTRLLLPWILLFALYVLFHGELSPGGGFQAGTIFAAGFMLYGLIAGLDRVYGILPVRALRALMSLGVLLYLGVGLACMPGGGAFLDYDYLPAGGQHLGIALIELGVGTTVAATLLLFFYAFTSPSAPPG